MLTFVVRRLGVSFLTLLAATFVVYSLVAITGNPLQWLAQDTSANKAQKIALATERLHLDQPIPVRYLHWLGDATGCVIPGRDCNLGLTMGGQQVTDLLPQAMASTLRLVLLATILSIVLGITVGIVSALRQYSGFDYAITFSAFLFFSLPIFWVAVLLKQYLGIAFNNWLADPRVGVLSTAVLSVLAAATWQAVLGGNRRRRLLVAAVAGGVTAVSLVYLSAVQWFTRPALGPAAVALLSVGSAVGITELISGIRNRRVLLAGVVSAVVGVVVALALGGLLDDPSWGLLFGLWAASLVTGGVVGYLLGGLDRRSGVAVGALSAAVTGVWVFADRVLVAVPDYATSVNGRLIATVGSNTPDYSGNFWVVLLDQVGHQLLPTLAIMLISFATYSRYTRATMLEVMNQDYVRTARSKGLTERTVVMRHAFRNALIPVTTLMAYDFGAVLAGAIITEYVFGWRGMGSLFITGLGDHEPNPVMGFFLVTAIAVVVFNMLADILYAYLDPRIRLS